MTSLQIEKLKKYEHQFHTAIEAKYLRAQPQSYYKELVQVCGELGIHINLNCPSCVYNAVTQLGRMYFDAVKPQQPDQPADADKVDNRDITNNADKKDDVKKAGQDPDKQTVTKTKSKVSKTKSGASKSKSNKTNKK